MQHSDIVFHLFLPPYEQAPEPVQPAVGAFYYPATGPVSRDCRFVYPFFSPAPNMAGIAPRCHQLPHLRVVVSLVQAQILGLLWGYFRTWDHDGLQRTFHQLPIVPVRPLHHHRDGKAMARRQQAPFGPAFAPVRRIGTGSFFPPRELWSWLRPWLAIPNQGRAGYRTLTILPAKAA